MAGVSIGGKNSLENYSNEIQLNKVDLKKHDNVFETTEARLEINKDIIRQSKEALTRKKITARTLFGINAAAILATFPAQWVWPSLALPVSAARIPLSMLLFKQYEGLGHLNKVDEALNKEDFSERYNKKNKTKEDKNVGTVEILNQEVAAEIYEAWVKDVEDSNKINFSPADVNNDYWSEEGGHFWKWFVIASVSNFFSDIYTMTEQPDIASHVISALSNGYVCFQSKSFLRTNESEVLPLQKFKEKSQKNYRSLLTNGADMVEDEAKPDTPTVGHLKQLSVLDRRMASFVPEWSSLALHQKDVIIMAATARLDALKKRDQGMPEKPVDPLLQQELSALPFVEQEEDVDRLLSQAEDGLLVYLASDMKAVPSAYLSELSSHPPSKKSLWEKAQALFIKPRV